jgi:protein arginine kinase
MTTPPTADQAGPWLQSDCPDGDVVVSTRVRLARNLAAFPFVNRTSPLQRRQVMQTCRERILESNLAPQMLWVDLAESSKLDRHLLVERHLISRQHGVGELERGVAISSCESVSLMVNEEDHLRIQVLRGGSQLPDAFHHADGIDDRLADGLDFAFSPKLGFLTACPTNVGTGIRLSAMLHLPALRLTGEIEKLRQAAKDMHLAIRGAQGEGSEVQGDLFQLSNQTTLGRGERAILQDFQSSILPQVVDYERRARQALMDQRAAVIDDRIQRAWAVLTHARLLGSRESMELLSSIRLGVCLGRLTGLTLTAVNELMLLTQPAHIQKIAGRSLNAPQRREFRASFVRRRLGV